MSKTSQDETHYDTKGKLGEKITSILLVLATLKTLV
jgi:hypothetical protein